MGKAENIIFDWIKKKYGSGALLPAAIVFVVLSFLGISSLIIYGADNFLTNELEEKSGVGGGNEEDLIPTPMLPIHYVTPTNSPELTGYFPDDFSKWSNEDMYLSKNDLLCAEADTDYESPAIWLLEEVPLAFDEITTSFIAQASQDDKDIPAPTVLFLGNYEDIPIFRCHLLETSYYQIGCLVYDSSVVGSEPMRRTEPDFLEKVEISPGTEVNVTIQSRIIPDGYVKYTLSVEGEEEGMEIGTVKPPYPNLEKARVQFGIGTTEGDCIDPRSYSIDF